MTCKPKISLDTHYRDIQFNRSRLRRQPGRPHRPTRHQPDLGQNAGTRRVDQLAMGRPVRSLTSTSTSQPRK